MTTISSSSSKIRMSQEPNQDSSNSLLPKSAEVERLLTEVKQLLAKNEPKAALALITRSRLASAWLTNAAGVCNLRLNHVATAMGMFRNLVLSRIGITLRDDIPIVFKANFATALLLSNNLSGCQEVLAEIHDQHPAGARLSEAIHRFTKNLTRWQMTCWYLGFVPHVVLPADFQPGDID